MFQKLQLVAAASFLVAAEAVALAAANWGQMLQRFGQE